MPQQGSRGHRCDSGRDAGRGAEEAGALTYVGTPLCLVGLSWASAMAHQLACPVQTHACPSLAGRTEVNLSLQRPSHWLKEIK